MVTQREKDIRDYKKLVKREIETARAEDAEWHRQLEDSAGMTNTEGTARIYTGDPRAKMFDAQGRARVVPPTQRSTVTSRPTVTTVAKRDEYIMDRILEKKMRCNTPADECFALEARFTDIIAGEVDAETIKRAANERAKAALNQEYPDYDKFAEEIKTINCVDKFFIKCMPEMEERIATETRLRGTELTANQYTAELEAQRRETQKRALLREQAAKVAEEDRLRKVAEYLKGGK